MFNIGPSEMMLLGVLFLFLFGPRKLPEIGKALGEGLAAFRQHSRALTEEMNRHIEAESQRDSDKEANHESEGPSHGKPMTSAAEVAEATQVEKTEPAETPAPADKPEKTEKVEKVEATPAA